VAGTAAKDSAGPAKGDAKPGAILRAEKAPEAEAAGPFQFGKLLLWGWRVISWAPLLFLATVVLALLRQVFTQTNVKVLEGAVAILQDEPVKGLASLILPQSKMGVAFMFLAVGVGILVLSFLSRVVGMLCDNVLIQKLQQRLHDKMLTLGPEYHQKHQQGELTAVVMNYSTGAEMLLTGTYSMPIVSGLSFVTAVGFLADSLSKAGAIPVALQVALLAVLVASPLVGWKLAARLKAAYTGVRERNIALTNELMNSTANPVEVQVMSAQWQRSAAFARRLKDFFAEQFRAAVRSEVSNQFQSSTILILQILFVFSAAYFASRNPGSGRQVAGPILGFILLIPSVVAPLQEIVAFWTGLQRSWPSVEVVIGLLETPPEVQDRPGAEELRLERAPAIELRDVTFFYEPGRPRILDCVRHTFEAGRVTAIVARAGMGKTSVLNLVCRLRDPVEGAITIDGKDLRDLRVDSVRRAIARASQFPLFIVDTIRANFHLAKADATDAELEALCRKTGLWTILTKVSPEAPLDFILPRNEGLSGGERRQLSVTRALIHHPRVLLLDEPTTGVDATSRQALVHCLRESCQGMTVLLVDHDMNFIRQWADRVGVLENGKFVEDGSPEELLARPDSLYKRLWEDYNKDQE